MVEKLTTFANEVTRVSLDVGTKGKLGGQAVVEGVEGTWQELTAVVNKLAENLTTQVRVSCVFACSTSPVFSSPIESVCVHECTFATC